MQFVSARNKIALVTAGTRGLGRAIVEMLLDAGATVAVCARNAAQLEEIRALAPERVFAQSVDLIDTAATIAFANTVVKTWGTVDWLFYNAPNPLHGPLDTLSLETWDRDYAGIIRNLVALCEVLIPPMQAQQSGSVVVLSSIAAIEPRLHLATSSTFRAGLAAWIKVAAQTYGRDGIRVNGVVPGFIKTDRLTELATELARTRNIGAEEIYTEWIQSIPLQRLGTPREIANAALFLSSDAATYITGTTLLIDGGLARGI